MNLKKIGPWTVKSERPVFDNSWIRIEDHAVIHPDGSDGEYGVVRFKNIAVGILPVDENGDVWLVGQHRYPHDCYSWELPEGGGRRDVSTLETAQRELEEEIGMTAQNWAEFGGFHISNSVTDEVAVHFFAWSLQPGRAKPDPSEALTLKKVKFETLLEMVMDGRVQDSLTIIMTLRAHLLALRGAAPAPISKALRAGAAFQKDVSS